MKKILFTILLFVFSLTTVKANTLNSVKMDIYINNEGNAHIVETWDATYNDKTEGYKPYENLGESQLTNFTVKMDDKEFTYVDSWNIDESFENKAYTNGINYISDGIELCFGISEYGNHTYTLEYDISNFVLELTDSQMVYWTLFPKNFGDEVKSVYIKIYSDFKYEDTFDVWGYGNYGGTAYVYDGYIEMQSDGELDTDEYMTILVKFPLGSFMTQHKDEEQDFDYYLNMSKEGSKKYEKSFIEKLFEIISKIISFIFTYGLFFIVPILAVILNKPKYYKGGFKKLNKDAPMFRDIPCKGDIYRAYFTSTSYGLTKNDTDFLGSILLRWLKLKQISIKKEEGTGLLKKDKTSIVFESVEPSTILEKEIYEMMYEASEDGILEENEFKKWCSKNYSKILNWFDKALQNENEVLAKDGSLKEKTYKKLGIFNAQTYEENPAYLEEANQLYGLKKYLLEFSNMDTKEAIEVHLWNDYLIYAQMFGIAKKVAEQFKKLYPDVIEDLNYESVIFINNVTTSGISSASSAKARAENYSSGGGGFSSGGGGGGSFGGGGGGGGSR